MQDVGSICPEIRAEKFRDFGLRQFFEILGQVFLGIAPGEVGIRLGKAKLGEPVHDLGPGEGFSKEDHLRMRGLYFRNDPLPEGKRFGVRIVDAEDEHTLLDPVIDDAFQFGP